MNLQQFSCAQLFLVYQTWQSGMDTKSLLNVTIIKISKFQLHKKLIQISEQILSHKLIIIVADFEFPIPFTLVYQKDERINLHQD